MRRNPRPAPPPAPIPPSLGREAGIGLAQTRLAPPSSPAPSVSVEHEDGPTLKEIQFDRQTWCYVCSEEREGRTEYFEFRVSHSEETVQALARDGRAAFTTREFAEFLAWASRARSAGRPFTIADLARWSSMRMKASDLGLVFICGYKPAETPHRPRGWVQSVVAPPGWRMGPVMPCAVCGVGTVWVNADSVPLHVGH